MVRKVDPKKCEWCGKVFEPYKKEQLYCSRACSAEAKAAVRVKKVCKLCGEEFEASNELVQYCSEKCRNNYTRIRFALEEELSQMAISLIRYGQTNPFSKPSALWVVFKEEYKDKFNGE